MKIPASNYYNKLAQYYEQATSTEGAWTPPKMIKKFLAGNFSEQSFILDIGIGTGQSSSFLFEGSRNPKVFGIDVSAEMLSICHDKFPEVTLFNTSLENFKKENSLQFDIIISSGAFEFIEDLDAVFHCVYCLLKTNGRFIFTFEPFVPGHEIQSERKSLVVKNQESSLFTEDFYTYRRSLEEVTEMVSSAGLDIEKYEEFVAYQKEGEDIVYFIVECVPKHLNK